MFFRVFDRSKYPVPVGSASFRLIRELKKLIMYFKRFVGIIGGLALIIFKRRTFFRNCSGTLNQGLRDRPCRFRPAWREVGT